MAIQICLRLDERFNKFEHNFSVLGMEMAELHKEYAKLRSEIARKEVEHCGQIVVLENEVKKLREQNGILTSRLMNNAVEEREKQQNLTNIQSMVQNNGNASVKLERENVDKVGVVPCPADRGQQHEIAPQQIVEQKPHYTVNPLDELNESPVDRFGQIEENAFDEEGDEIMADNSMEMDGIRERMDDFYGNNLSPNEGPSNIGANDVDGDGQKLRHHKKKLKFLICQWPGCGYRASKNTVMKRHWRTHTGERPYCCKICGQSFARLDNMKKHELTRHNLL